MTIALNRMQLKELAGNKYKPCAIMSKTKSRSHSTSGSYETRLVAAQSFQKGDRVRHRVNGEQGKFQKIDLSYALPEVWVQFESDSEISVPTSCNPLDLEPVSSDSNQTEEMPLMSEPSEAEAILVTAVEVLEELTEAEEADRQRLEIKVERAFYEAGAALRELRDKRLYRSTHRTFEEYCYERFGYTRRRPYQLIEAAIIFENLCTIGTQNSEQDNLCTNGTQNDLSPNERQILPTSERQVRDLINLEPDEQREVWLQAVEEVGGKVPTGRVVKSIVERLKEKTLRNTSDFCSIGDAFILARLEGAERK